MRLCKCCHHSFGSLVSLVGLPPSSHDDLGLGLDQLTRGLKTSQVCRLEDLSWKYCGSFAMDSHNVRRKVQEMMKFPECRPYKLLYLRWRRNGWAVLSSLAKVM
jgi:hypothetical protein